MVDLTPVVSGELCDAEVVVGTCVEERSVEITTVSGRLGWRTVIAEV